MSLWYEWFPTDLIIKLRDSSESGDMSDKEEFLNSIKSLDLSGHRLSAVPDFVKEMKNLTSLSLANNKLSGNLDGSAFPDNLEFLSLEGNSITSFNMEGFSATALKNLVQLDLSRNCLESIPENLHLASSLRVVNLSNNKISEIDKDVKLPAKIYILNLRGNNLTSVKAGRYGITKCTEINLSNNKLTTVDSTLLKGKVSIIDATGNNIEDWDFIPLARKKGITVYT